MYEILRWKRSPVILNWTWLVDEHCVRHTPVYNIEYYTVIFHLRATILDLIYFIIRYIPFVHWLISHLTGSRNSHVAPRIIYANMKSNLEIEMGETRVDMHWTCVMICSCIVCLPLGLRMHIVLLLALYTTLSLWVCVRESIWQSCVMAMVVAVDLPYRITEFLFPFYWSGSSDTFCVCPTIANHPPVYLLCLVRTHRMFRLPCPCSRVKRYVSASNATCQHWNRQTQSHASKARTNETGKNWEFRWGERK